jgi:hypothetical protein
MLGPLRAGRVTAVLALLCLQEIRYGQVVRRSSITRLCLVNGVFFLLHRSRWRSAAYSAAGLEGFPVQKPAYLLTSLFFVKLTLGTVIFTDRDLINAWV